LSRSTVAEAYGTPLIASAHLTRQDEDERQ
jgi:hypothetical protein